MTELTPDLIEQTRRITHSEVPFDFHEIFFSRTDSRGVIQAGNTVFRRVSGFEWDALLGAPHKVVRHPDTPKGLFHLMWEKLKAGQPVGAYVKNRSKDGRYYWVFAIALPSEDGYISMRIKPSSPILDEIKTLYADLIRQEAAGTSPADSAAALRAWLGTQGYESYDMFQSMALVREVEERARRLDRPLDQTQKRFLLMSSAISEVHGETGEMTEAFKAIRTVPMNMRILASRLENAGGPISAISVNYGSMLDEMAAWVRTFVEGRDSVFARIQASILTGQFLTFVTVLQEEMSSLFAREGDSHDGKIDAGAETALLRAQVAKYTGLAVQSLSVVEVEAERLARSVLDMKRYVTGLSSTRMMCKIESATLSHSGDALVGIVDQLDACQNEIESRLSRIVELNMVIQSNTAMLRVAI